MVESPGGSLRADLTALLQADEVVCAAVLFGSQVRPAGTTGAADGWSDVDLHVVTSDPTRLEQTNWSQALPNQRHILSVNRPATGGVRKLTLLFADGEADLVLVPAGKLRLAAVAMTLGLHRRLPFLAAALNNMATIMGGGYQFLKGEARWGAFYAKVVRDLPGFRVPDPEARALADVSLCDLLWVFQKLQRGELIAAQRILHRSVLETNVVLLHEARVRRGAPTYQQARRIERLASPSEIAAVRGNARLDAAELSDAAWSLLEGLKRLMAELVPSWRVPAEMEALLAPYGRKGG